MNFVPGQRWHSLTEPELGLGLVEAVENRQVLITFPARGVTRRYAAQGAPLERAQLTPGQQVRGGDVEFLVESVEQVDGLLVYQGSGQRLTEAELDAGLDVVTPENRLRSGQVDDTRLFDLRAHALELRHRMLASPARGFLGGRIRLFDHQLSIARDVCERHRVRVLLADEVGLGKTIEALLILHRLLLSGRVETALILVPPALVHQWLAEAYLRFNLMLQVMGDGGYGGDPIDPTSDTLAEDLTENRLFICPLGLEVGEAFVEAPWDIVIVDEAHHLEPGSDEFDLVERLAGRVEHLVLLSATPDRDSEDGHFRRLALLDPVRFRDAQAYRDEAATYQVLADTAERLQDDGILTAKDATLLRDRLRGEDVDALLAGADTDAEARRALLGRLLDLHGIGRVMFRNVRARIPGFPRRRHEPVVLQAPPPLRERLQREFLHDLGGDDPFRFHNIDTDPRTGWLLTFLNELADEKVLVLCASRLKVEAFARSLSAGGRQVVTFHEEMGAIERDRQAAWFLDAEGPQVVVCSAIGAEGRNFQVARHLVLLDLPLSPDRLEQAIGRVDRIGQGAEVFIHPVIVEGTPQARLWRWHAEALRLFERPWHGSPAIEREFGQELLKTVLDTDDVMDALVQRGRQRNERILEELETGRDRLLELTSFDVAAAQQLHGAIARAESDGVLEAFMLEAFERGGLDVEHLGNRSYAVRVGADTHGPFPGLVGDEMGITFDRATSLLHPERALLTWDHPMVRDTLDQLLGRETGNAAIAGFDGDDPGIQVEALYVAEPEVHADLRADRFFPPTPIRVVVDAQGEEVDLEPAAARAELTPVDPALLQDEELQMLLPDLLAHTRMQAEARAPDIARLARRRMRRELEPAVARLAELAAANPSVPAAELDAARGELAALDAGLGEVRVRLDGLRLILVDEN